MKLYKRHGDIFSDKYVYVNFMYLLLFVFYTCSLHWPDEFYHEVLSFLWLVA